ncbi:hypothetical protein, partial [Streptomyces sp. NPDC007070]|uniref:hypothetical protein n=1 Tax=Streptomyces sp. NPDC007070 TaxID=3154312 RepID=UPI0033C8400E
GDYQLFAFGLALIHHKRIRPEGIVPNRRRQLAPAAPPPGETTTGTAAARTRPSPSSRRTATRTG